MSMNIAFTQESPILSLYKKLSSESTVSKYTSSQIKYIDAIQEYEDSSGIKRLLFTFFLLESKTKWISGEDVFNTFNLLIDKETVRDYMDIEKTKSYLSQNGRKLSSSITGKEVVQEYFKYLFSFFHGMSVYKKMKGDKEITVFELKFKDKDKKKLKFPFYLSPKEVKNEEYAELIFERGVSFSFLDVFKNKRVVDTFINKRTKILGINIKSLEKKIAIDQDSKEMIKNELADYQNGSSDKLNPLFFELNHFSLGIKGGGAAGVLGALGKVKINEVLLMNDVMASNDNGYVSFVPLIFNAKIENSLMTLFRMMSFF